MQRFDKKVSKREDNFRHPPGSYDYTGLAHWWAYNFGYRSTAGGRMSANGNEILSYSTVVARMFDPPKGHSYPLVLITTRKYSSTTAKQIYAIEAAVRHMTVLHVDDPSPANKKHHLNNLEAILNEVILLAEKAKRARTRKDDYLKRISVRLDEGMQYAEYFRLRRTKIYKRLAKIASGDTDVLEKAIQSREEIKRIKDEEKRREQEAEKQRAKKAIERANRTLEEWLSGGSQRPDYRYLDKIYMRVFNGVIETTEGASLELRVAKIAFDRYKKGKLTPGMHIGAYDFRGVFDGIAKIGCHSIPLEDIERLLESHADVGSEEDFDSIQSLIDELDSDIASMSDAAEFLS